MLGLVCPRIVGQRFGCRCLSQCAEFGFLPVSKALRAKFCCGCSETLVGGIWQWTISFNSKELAGRQGTKLGWSCGLVPTPSKHSLQARVSNILYVIQHRAAFSLTHCSIPASDQRVINAFKLWPHYILRLLRLLRPGRPSWLDPNLMGSPP